MPKGSLQARKRVTSQVADLRFRFTTRKGTTISTYRWERLAVRSASLQQLQKNIALARLSRESRGAWGTGQSPTVYAAKVQCRPLALLVVRGQGGGLGAPRTPPPSRRSATRRGSNPERRQPSAAVPAPGHQRQEQERLERRKGLTARGSRYAAVRRAAEPDGRLRL